MQEKIKLIWDFHGYEAENFAKHHSIHLKEFIDKNSLTDSFSEVEKLNEMHFIACIISAKDNMLLIRDSLRPHRAQKVEF